MAKRKEGTWLQRPATWLRAHAGLRFLLAGGLNTLFGFAVYTVAVLAGLNPRGALLAGMVMGTFFNFVTTGGYAFRQLTIRRFPRFVLCYLATYAVNVAVIDWLSPLAGGPLRAQALALVPMAALSYGLMSRWVFRESRS